MSLFSNFINSLNSTKKSEFTSRLHQKVSAALPQCDENIQLKVACISGLLARVANNDLVIEKSEVETIKSSLQKWTNLNKDEIDSIAKISVDEVQELAGIENHLYCLPIREALSVEERYNILVGLFAVAAADGNVENSEAEEIRNICNALLLEPKHFLSAKSTVLESLGALKKN